MIRRTQQSFIVLIAAVVLTAGCSDKPSAESAANVAIDTAAEGHSGVLRGVVTDSAGQPVVGAFVRLDSTDERLTFMVISQSAGRYTADRLPAGSYVVQAVGNDFESAPATVVNISEQESAQMDLALTVSRAPDLPAAWPRRVPEHLATASSLPEGRGKEIIMARCTGCHSEVDVVERRVDRETWEATITEMRELMVAGNLPDLSDEDVAILTDYLAANLLPMPAPDPNSRLPRTLLQGEAMNYRVVQYNIENELAEAHDVAVDPWGVGWANQRTGGKISRFDPVSYEYREIGPPLYTAKRARPGNLQISRDGIMWLPDPFETRWLSYDIAADEWTDWPFPTEEIRGQVQGNSMALHQDGTIWSAGPAPHGDSILLRANGARGIRRPGPGQKKIPVVTG